MTVFSDQDNSVISGGTNAHNNPNINDNGQQLQLRPGSVSRQSQLLAAAETQSNAYATINKLPMLPASRRSLFGQDNHDFLPDYATLEKTAKSPPGT